MTLDTRNHAASVNAGLAHIEGHINATAGSVDVYVSRIAEGASNISLLSLMLSSYHMALALRGWFKYRDYRTFRQNMYVSGCLIKMRYTGDPRFLLFSPYAASQDLFQISLSNESGLIEWATHFDGLDMKRACKVSTYEFLSLQAKLALRGDWSALRERSEQWLDAMPATLKKFAPDQRFYLALAKADVPAMTAAIQEMLLPKQIRWRNEHEGYTGNFVVRQAVIYAKIARMKGFQLEIDSPWVPAEWLALSPLDGYANPYPLILDSDVGGASLLRG